ncbi:hypothetical protein HanIR_Chr10g0462471 [Helianthus annuus]|nr:hypothetical protein HanIR_Chr10g0462471 [Helianthus annuus]
MRFHHVMWVAMPNVRDETPAQGAMPKPKPTRRGGPSPAQGGRAHPQGKKNLVLNSVENPVRTH